MSSSRLLPSGLPLAQFCPLPQGLQVGPFWRCARLPAPRARPHLCFTHRIHGAGAVSAILQHLCKPQAAAAKDCSAQLGGPRAANTQCRAPGVHATCHMPHATCPHARMPRGSAEPLAHAAPKHISPSLTHAEVAVLAPVNPPGVLDQPAAAAAVAQ